MNSPPLTRHILWWGCYSDSCLLFSRRNVRCVVTPQTLLCSSCWKGKTQRKKELQKMEQKKCLIRERKKRNAPSEHEVGRMSRLHLVLKVLQNLQTHRKGSALSLGRIRPAFTSTPAGQHEQRLPRTAVAHIPTLHSGQFASSLYPSAP